jgi:hypothetical protein
MAPKPGLLYGLTKPTDPSISDKNFNEWYNTGKHH